MLGKCMLDLLKLAGAEATQNCGDLWCALQITAGFWVAYSSEFAQLPKNRLLPALHNEQYLVIRA